MKDFIEYLAHLYRVIRYHFSDLVDELRGDTFKEWKRARTVPLPRITLAELAFLEKFPEVTISLGALNEPNEFMSEVSWYPTSSTPSGPWELEKGDTD